MAAEIAEWLQQLGLAKYAEIFVEHEIDLDAARDLTESDLKELKLPMGPRKKLLRAISSLALQNVPHITEPENTTHGNKSSEVVEETETLVERRQLTVMFCDLVGSTELSGLLDPEDMREVLRRYQDVVAGIVTRHGGFVANYLGDGVLAYFGWPVAHDEQAVQAVHAALAAAEAVPNIETPHRRPILARVGIATGEVVVGDLDGQISRQAGAVAGETPNLAARLEGLARPGQVVVGDLTRRLLGDNFKLADHGKHELKGISGRVQSWIVIGARSSESRFEARGHRLSQLIGREHELGLLENRWLNARSGEGQVVLISGEPGIGKSHLAHSLIERANHDDPIVLRYQCSSYRTQTAYFPIIQHIERAAGFAASDAADVRLDKLATLFRASDEALRLVANLLLLPFEHRFGTIDLPPEQRKRRTNDTLVEHVLGLSVKQPVLMLFEDAHWLDRSSQELVGEVITRIVDAPVLLLITHRSEWTPEWSKRSHMTVLPLSRVSRREGKAMIESIAGQDVSEKVATEIIQRSDGIPLFIEELTKSAIEHSLDSSGSGIPETLQASLSARLDRLGADLREVVQVAAVLGREFQHQLILQVVDRSEEVLNEALEDLLETGLLLRRGLPPDAIYSFSHALIQDAAYASSLRKKRQSLHLAAAQVLTGSQSACGQDQPELIAHHYEEGGRLDNAIKYRVAAGDQATAKSAGNEAAAHYRTALNLLGQVEPSTNADIEIEANLKLANALMLVGGYTSQEAFDAWERGRSLAAQKNDTENYLRAALGIVPPMFAKGLFASALKLFEGYADSDLVALNHVNQVHYCASLGTLHVCISDPKSAKPLLERGLQLNAREPCTPRNPWGGADPKIPLLGYDAMNKHMQLQPLSVMASANAAISAAENFEDPFGLVWSQVIKLRALVWIGLYEEAVAHANHAEELASRYGFTQRMANIVSFRGIANIGRGLTDTGIDEVISGLDAWSERGGLFHLAQWYCDAAEVALQTGRLDAAKEFVRRAQFFERKMELPTAEAQLLHLRGALALDAGDLDAATSLFVRAIEVARRSGTRLFELRAALSLAYANIATDDEARPIELVRTIVDGLGQDDIMPETTAARQLLAS